MNLFTCVRQTQLISWKMSFTTVYCTLCIYQNVLGGYWLFTLRESIACLSGMEKNFRMQDGETFSLPYDASSIMHYGRYSTQNDKCITNCFSVKVTWYFKMITLVSGIFFQRLAFPPSSQRKMWKKWDREINWQRLTLKGFDVSTAVVYFQLCSLHINFISDSDFTCLLKRIQITVIVILLTWT